MSRRPLFPPPHLALSALAFVVLLAGCRVDVTVGIRASDAGAGTVRARADLDRDAVRFLGAAPGTALKLDDLRAAGWSFTPPRTRSGGRLVVEGTKHFDSPAQLRHIITELAGGTTLFSGFSLQRTRSPWHSRLRLRGTVDLRGVQGLDDELLAQGRSSGVEPTELQSALRAIEQRAFRLRVLVDLPGPTRDNAPHHVASNPVWSPSFGERATIVASSRHVDVRRLGFTTLAITLAGTALVITLAARRRPSPHTPS